MFSIVCLILHLSVYSRSIFVKEIVAHVLDLQFHIPPGHFCFTFVSETAWSNWGACSTTCGPGQRKRTNGKKTETQDCNLKDCPPSKSCTKLGNPFPCFPLYSLNFTHMFTCCTSALVDSGLGQLCVMFFPLAWTVASCLCIVLQWQLMVAWASCV